MNREQIEGTYEEAKGSLREGWGRLTDQPDVARTYQPDAPGEGRVDQITGKTKQIVGTVKENVIAPLKENVIAPIKESVVEPIKESVSSAVQQIRQDPSMQQSETRKAALKLLAYAAGLLILLISLFRGARRRR